MPLIPRILFMLSCCWGILPGDGVGTCAIPVAVAPHIRSARRPAAAGTIECFWAFMVPLILGRAGRSGDLGVAAGGISEPNLELTLPKREPVSYTHLTLPTNREE